MNIPKLLQQLAFLAAGLGAGAASADYVGTLKLPGAPSATSSFYAFSASAPTNITPTFSTATTTDATYRLKLGYKYSRFLSFESEYVDFSNASGGIFSNPTVLSSAFRSTGFGVDTVATVPLWRQFSFYGRLGAYSGSRNIFSSNPVSLLGDSTRARVRYGLGMRYDFTKAFGIRAELERYSPLATPLTGEAESDVFTVGLSWRF
jgi:OOP family OmpA-OmpF porin